MIQELRRQPPSAAVATTGSRRGSSSLTAQRDRLRAEVDRLREQNRLWSQLAVKIKELDDQIAAAEAEVRKAEHAARTIEIAVGLKPNWRKREKLDEQLGHLSGRVKLPDDAIERLNATQRRHRKAPAAGRRAAGPAASASRRGRPAGDQRAAGPQRLAHRRPGRAARLAAVAPAAAATTWSARPRSYETRFAAEQKRLGEALGPERRPAAPRADARPISKNLQPHIDALRLAQKRLDAAQRDLDMLTESERSLRTQIETAIIGGESHRLPMDLDEAEQPGRPAPQAAAGRAAARAGPASTRSSWSSRATTCSTTR